MELVFLLLALQLAASAAGFAWLWRRQQRLSGEIARLERELAARETVAARRSRRAQAGAIVSLPVEGSGRRPVQEAPEARAARLWKLPAERITRALQAPLLTVDTARGLALALVATLPLAALPFGASESAVAAAGLAAAAAMMLISLRPTWREAAWPAVLTAATWALIGFVRGAAHAEPVSYSICVAAAAGAGLIYACLRRLRPGAVMTLAMAAAALALAGQTAVIGPAGAAFGLILAASAIVGAMSLRLESVHLAAFGGALIGLFVLSGQESAAIWFTPIAAWMGALFFAVAAIRVPQLGPRGAALAGTGALAPFAAIAALHAAQHGLADRYAAAGAFAALAALLAGLIAVSAARGSRGLAGLRLTLWTLALGAFASASSAIGLAASPPLASTALAALALGLVALNLRAPDAAWRAFAAVAGIGVAVFALVSAEMLLMEAPDWPPPALIALGVALPTVIAGAAVVLAARAHAQATAGFFEALAIILGVACANLLARLLFSAGAPLLQPISFAEAGAHVAIWLASAMLIGAYADERGVRTVAVRMLSFTGFVAMIFASAQWASASWGAPAALAGETSGFLLPGLMFWAQWVFWRARGAELQTRLALGAGALSVATYVTLEAMAADVPEWAGALTGALSFALAIGVNFAPGVTGDGRPLEPSRRRPR